ncbi:MAG: hypothetical protein ACRERX_21825 [Pseudomonas sp.]
MPDPAALVEETAQQVERLGSLDFVVGVASQDNAATIGAVVQAARAGLEQAFPGARVAVIHADSGSRDETAERARTALPGDALVQVQTGSDGTSRLTSAPLVRASALQAIFEVATRLSARGCAVFDADVTSVSPEWVARLLAPVAADRADFITPNYARHRFAGAITTSVLYPMVRALYGRRIRYPVAGEFACSTRVLQHFRAAPGWRAEVARLSIDLWLTTEAIVAGFRLAQTDLGVKTQVASEGAVDLSGTLSKVLGALFLQAERTAAHWQKVRGSQAVPVDGANQVPSPEAAPADARRALDAFRLGQRNLADIWAAVLPPGALLELNKLARRPDAEFCFPDALWARIVYDFAIAHRTRVMNRDHLLSAFTPLYSGWLGGFIEEMQTAGEAEVDARIEKLCLQYEAEKPYLISRWRWPDRFNP